MPRNAPPAKPQPAPAQPTPAAAFRRSGLYILPGSGHVVRLRWPGVYALAAAGTLPNPLLDALAGNTVSSDPEQRRVNFRRNAEAYLVAAELCLVEPRLVRDRAPDYDAGEIGPDDLGIEDLDFIFFSYLRRGPASDAAIPFRLSDAADA